MRLVVPLCAAVLAYGALLPTATIAAERAHRVVRFPLDEQNASTQHGSVTLTEHGAETIVVVDLRNEPPDVYEPSHIHAGDACETMDPTPTYPLSSVYAGHAISVVHVPLRALEHGRWVLNVHSAQDITHYVACGKLRR